MNLHSEQHLVFSYGTLKRGFPNDHLMEDTNASYIADAITENKYPLLQAGAWHVPFLIHHKGYPGSYRVRGELYRVTTKGLAVLDKFEGVGNGYYKRLVIDVSYEKNGDTISTKAWCYFRSQETSELLTDTSKFVSFFGKEELQQYIPPEERPGDWKSKRNE